MNKTTLNEVMCRMRNDPEVTARLMKNGSELGRYFLSLYNAGPGHENEVTGYQTLEMLILLESFHDSMKDALMEPLLRSIKDAEDEDEDEENDS